MVTDDENKSVKDQSGCQNTVTVALYKCGSFIAEEQISEKKKFRGFLNRKNVNLLAPSNVSLCELGGIKQLVVKSVNIPTFLDGFLLKHFILQQRITF